MGRKHFLGQAVFVAEFARIRGRARILADSATQQSMRDAALGSLSYGETAAAWWCLIAIIMTDASRRHKEIV